MNAVKNVIHCICWSLLLSWVVSAEDSVSQLIQPKGKEDINREDAKDGERQFDALKNVATNQMQINEYRIDAIMEMEALKSTNVVDYLLQDISLFLKKQHFAADDDYLKEYPCYYVLKRKGEIIAPDVLRYLEKSRNTNDLARVGKLLDKIMGSAKAMKLLEQKKQQKENDAASMVLQTNIDIVCSSILEEEQIRKRWKDLNDAAKAQGSKREK
ncbi:MAG: hypothetical protein H7831_17705 [Magnetococcus sp. WYHC-3]